MKRISKARADIVSAAEPVRTELADDWPNCMLCSRRQASDTHEITRGPARSKSLGTRSCLLRLCRMCHLYVHDKFSPARQLCLKAIREPDWYDRLEVNKLRGRAPDSISESDVWSELKWVLNEIRVCGGRLP